MENNAKDITENIAFENMPNVDVSRETGIVEQDATMPKEMEQDAKQEENASNDNENSTNEENDNEIKSMSYNKLRKLAKEKGLTFAKNVGKDELINIIENAEKVNANVVTLDNKPVSPIVLTNDKEEIPKGFVIHHIDFNPKNNDISNLALMSISAHAKLHNQIRNLSKVQRLSHSGVGETPSAKH